MKLKLSFKRKIGVGLFIYPSLGIPKHAWCVFWGKYYRKHLGLFGCKVQRQLRQKPGGRNAINL